MISRHEEQKKAGHRLFVYRKVRVTTPPFPLSVLSQDISSRPLHDIVQGPTASERLGSRRGVEGQGPEKLALLGDDPEVWAGDQQSYLPVLVGDADWDMA